MRIIAIVFVYFLGAACHAERAAPTVNEEPTLAILGEDGVTCAAVALSTTLAVTANHCVPDRQVAFVTASRDGKPDRTAYGVVVSRETSSDLAVFASTGLVPASLAPEVVDYEHATTLVTHVPKPWSVVTVRPTDAREGFLQTERLESGMSGSGLWDDGGRLVGIAVGNDQKSGYFAGTERMQRLLRAVPAVLPAPSAEAPVALWGDAQLSVDHLLANGKRRRQHIEMGLDALEHAK